MKILLATDGSAYSLAAAKRFFKMLFLNEKPTIRIICVAEEITGPAFFGGLSDKYLTIAKKTARTIAEKAVDETRQLVGEAISKRDVFIETKTIMGYPKSAILAEAESWGAEMIVVGSHGRGFLKRMFLGSVSNAIVRHAKCSVLVVRASESEVEKLKDTV